MNVCKQISFGAVEISGRQINEIAMEEKYYECATSFLIQLAQNHEAHPEENYEEIYQQTKNKISKKNIAYQVQQELIDQSCPIYDSSNALVINRTLKDQLMMYREQLQICLEKVKKQFQFNAEYLEKCKNIKRIHLAQSKTYYHKCAAPYFKNLQFKFAPNNPDYIYRKVVLKEFFPADIERVNCWKMSEKIAVVNNVKGQIIEHLKSKILLGHCKSIQTRKNMQKQKKIAAGDELSKMPLLDLWRKVQNDEESTFKINWDSVAFNAADGNHNEFECEGIWNACLRPDLTRKQWTEAENELLVNAVLLYNSENWDLIAAELQNRSSLMCFIQYVTQLHETYHVNVRWTEDEDRLLHEVIEACTNCGITNWKRVALLVPNRSRTQCYNRAKDGIGPEMKRGCFSNEENMIILNWVDVNGSDFRLFPANLLPNRKMHQIRNHYNITLKHEGNINVWTRDEDKVLLDFVAKEGQKKWMKLAEILKTHDRTSCRTRYQTIQKFLQKNPTMTAADVPIKKKVFTSVHKARGLVPIKVKAVKEKKISKRTQRAIETFQSTESMLYELFKYSFQYNMRRKLIPTNETTSTAEVAMVKLLEANISEIGNRDCFLTPLQSLKLHEMMNVFYNKELIKETKCIIESSNLSFCFPPSWNSIIGLRGISIKCNTFTEPVPEPKKSIGFENKTNELDEQVEKFKKRFHSLFYLTAMLSKLNLADLKEITQKNSPISTQGFVVQYVENSYDPQPHSSSAGLIVSDIILKGPSSKDSLQDIKILDTEEIPTSYSFIASHSLPKISVLSDVRISNKRVLEDILDENDSKKPKENIPSTS